MCQLLLQIENFTLFVALTSASLPGQNLTKACENIKNLHIKTIERIKNASSSHILKNIFHGNEAAVGLGRGDRDRQPTIVAPTVKVYK